MPIVIASRDTCPTTCTLQGAGCYAEHGKVGLHWNRINNGTAARLLDLAGLLRAIRQLPRLTRWRYGVAGDLPPRREDLLALADANRGREAIVYTHGRDIEAYREAGRRGLHINLSADSAAEADALAETGLSVVVVVPSDQTRASRTPAGRKIAVCPASLGRTNCLRCGVCAKPRPGGVIIGFPAHGVRKNAINARLQS